MPILRKQASRVQGGRLPQRELYRLLSTTPLTTYDTETTGIDLMHGARPFAFTFCDDELNNDYWIWDVDPLTRRVLYDRTDALEIRSRLEEAELLGLQNAKFDAANTREMLRDLKIKLKWPWPKTHDTLYAGHLLNSSQPHDLTTMALVYLGINIHPYEERLKQAVKECRNLCRTKDWTAEHGEWAIAKAGRPDMPSAKEETWKFDLWLPRAVAKELNLEPEHHYWTVLPEYMNIDSATTHKLLRKMIQLLFDKELLYIYLERIKLLPIVYGMEEHGLCVNMDRLKELDDQYRAESKEFGDVMVGMAKHSYDYELNLPKNGNNKSLLTFCFGEKDQECDTCNGKAADWYSGKECKACNGEGVIPGKRYLDLPTIKLTDTGNPSLDKFALDDYQVTLPERSKQRLFVTRLRGKRKRDTAIGYMESYKKFWIPEKRNGVWGWLYPSVNPTGTITLRWTSQNPNEQQISKQGMTEDDKNNLRYCFGPAPGREWWSLDYDNIELRIPAYESGERAMIEIFEKPNDPPYFGSYHLMNASIIYPDLFWPLAEQKGAFKKKYADTWYQWVKNFGFAVGYGAMEESGTADRAAHKVGAQRMVMDKLKEHSRLNQYWISYAQKHGYVETLPDKEVDPDHGYVIYCERTWGRVRPTVPLNSHVQGTACWVVMRAMIKIQEYFDELNSTQPADNHWHIVMNVHDEVVLDGPFSQDKGNEPIVKRVRGIMESVGDCISVPLTVGMNWHPISWANAA